METKCLQNGKVPQRLSTSKNHWFSTLSETIVRQIAILNFRKIFPILQCFLLVASYIKGSHFSLHGPEAKLPVARSVTKSDYLPKDLVVANWLRIHESLIDLQILSKITRYIGVNSNCKWASKKTVNRCPLPAHFSRRNSLDYVSARNWPNPPCK